MATHIFNDKIMTLSMTLTHTNLIEILSWRAQHQADQQAYIFLTDIPQVEGKGKGITSLIVYKSNVTLSQAVKTGYD